MIRMTIIGSGNVAQHLIQAFSKHNEIELVQVFSRRKEAVSHLIALDKIVSYFADLKEVDIYFLAVSDDAIASVSTQLPFENRLVVHTAGSVSMDILDKKNRRGVFYPLQTFSKSRAVDFKEVPICLETETESDYQILEKIARMLSVKVLKIDETQRKAIHVSAVFVNNFVNHLYQIGNEICSQNKLPFDILKPLILETAHKVMTLSPKEAQTGPSIRNDSKTVEQHLQFLEDENKNTIYKTLTQSIQHNGKKL